MLLCRNAHDGHRQTCRLLPEEHSINGCHYSDTLYKTLANLP